MKQKTSLDLVLTVMKKFEKFKGKEISEARRKKMRKLINKHLGNRLQNFKHGEDRE